MVLGVLRATLVLLVIRAMLEIMAQAVMVVMGAPQAIRDLQVTLEIQDQTVLAVTAVLVAMQAIPEVRATRVLKAVVALVALADRVVLSQALAVLVAVVVRVMDQVLLETREQRVLDER